MIEARLACSKSTERFVNPAGKAQKLFAVAHSANRIMFNTNLQILLTNCQQILLIYPDVCIAVWWSDDIGQSSA